MNPLSYLKSALNEALAQQKRVSAAVHVSSEARSTRYYPEWQSRVKARGKRDASQRTRSNRRKAARKAAAR